MATMLDLVQELRNEGKIKIDVDTYDIVSFKEVLDRNLGRNQYPVPSEELSMIGTYFLLLLKESAAEKCAETREAVEDETRYRVSPRAQRRKRTELKKKQDRELAELGYGCMEIAEKPAGVYTKHSKNSHFPLQRNQGRNL